MVHEYTDTNALPVTAKKLRKIRLFWLGFIIYTAAYAISKAYSGDTNRWYMIQSVGLVVCIPAAISLIRFKFDNLYLKCIYVLYCGWLCTVIGRGFTYDADSVKFMLFEAWYGIFLYFVPLLLLFPKNLFYLKKSFDAISVLSIIYIACTIFFRGDLLNSDDDDRAGQGLIEYFSKTLSIPSGFLLLTYVYHSNKRKLLALFVIMLTVLLAIIRARRGLIFMAISPLLFSGIIYLYKNKGKFLVMLFSLLVISLLSVYGFKLYKGNKNGIFSLITERADEDTRTGVEVCFYNDMKRKDWIVGKGINGEYYCPGIDSDFSNYREIIETDYLNIILKGGIISLGLLLLILIPAIFKGLFYSKNILSKAAGIWILLWLLDLYPATVNTFTLNYLLVWISIGICYSKPIRMMPESTIKQIFSS